MAKLLNSLFVAVLLLGIFASCGGKIEETYIMTTLTEATRGDLVSPGFKYGFDTPNFIAAVGSLALVREGSVLEFFAGQDIESKLKQVEGKKFTVAARKMFSPYPYFVVDYFIVGTDTITVGEDPSAALPPLRKGTEMAGDEWKTIDLGGLTSGMMALNDIKNTKFKMNDAKIAIEQLTMEGQSQQLYTLGLKRVRFIVDGASPGMLLVLKALMNEGKPFNGGVSYGDIPSDRAFRERTNIGGKVTIGWIIFGGNLIMPQTQG